MHITSSLKQIIRSSVFVGQDKCLPPHVIPTGKRFGRVSKLPLRLECLESRAMLSASDDLGLADMDQTYLLVADGSSLPTDLAAFVHEAGGEMESTIEEIGMAVVRSTDADFATRAPSIPGIQSLIPNVRTRVIGARFDVSLAVDDVTNPPGANDDFLYSLQWGLDAVNAPEAWEQGARGSGVRVAVLDTGVDTDHPDLSPNLNLGLSTSFVPGEPVEFDPSVGGWFSHGTHVAGTIAAADNAFGAIGVAPEAEIVAVKVLSDTGSGSIASGIAGIVYAADTGADVINMSFSSLFTRDGYDLGDPSDPTDDVFLGANVVADLVNAIDRATTYAYQRGATLIAAAGNDALDRDHDGNVVVTPADNSHVISVSATGPLGWGLDQSTNLDRPAYYTNFGQSAIDFAAPGGNVDFDLNASGQNCTVGPATAPCWVFDLVLSTNDAGWAWSSGTSMAAPHAAGVAALIIGQNGGDMHPAQVEAELRDLADDLGKPGRDDYYGQGRVNAVGEVLESTSKTAEEKANQAFVKKHTSVNADSAMTDATLTALSMSGFGLSSVQDNDDAAARSPKAESVDHVFPELTADEFFLFSASNLDS